ncbi:MAG: DUF86 domain-containing protein [Clostridiales bacterium]|nr:DUF86 domain-containing protein [Clostridiales bacterium]
MVNVELIKQRLNQLSDSLKNKENYLNDEETKTYRNMVGLRNILSHEYIRIDKKIKSNNRHC